MMGPWFNVAMRVLTIVLSGSHLFMRWREYHQREKKRRYWDEKNNLDDDTRY